MLEELYDIYKSNFKFNIRAKDTEISILSNKDNKVIEKRNENGKLIGVSVINKSTILMLCVDEEYRNKGIGSKLLKESEELVLKEGYNKINLGEGFDYLMPGVPIIDNNVEFFQKRGYKHSWGTDECFDMDLELKNITYTENVGDKIDGIYYRFATIDDLSEIERCVNDAEEKFTKYYMNTSLYDNSTNQKVLIALDNNEVCGTLIVSVQLEKKDTGSVGCTTTKTKYRHRKIASNMVRIGTKYLKDIGMKYGHLGYTYTGLDKMYGYAGYHITNKYMMAEKILKN